MRSIREDLQRPPLSEFIKTSEQAGAAAASPPFSGTRWKTNPAPGGDARKRQPRWVPQPCGIACAFAVHVHRQHFQRANATAQDDGRIASTLPITSSVLRPSPPGRNKVGERSSTVVPLHRARTAVLAAMRPDSSSSACSPWSNALPRAIGRWRGDRHAGLPQQRTCDAMLRNTPPGYPAPPLAGWLIARVDVLIPSVSELAKMQWQASGPIARSRPAALHHHLPCASNQRIEPRILRQ